MEEIILKEISEKIDIMKQIVSGFINIINQENTFLKNNDVAGVKSLYVQKHKTVSAYRATSAFFIKNRELLKDYNSIDKAELKDMSQELDQVLKANELLLKTRMAAGKSVMDTIINIAKTTNNANATSYGCKGRYTPLSNTHNALAFNRTL